MRPLHPGKRHGWGFSCLVLLGYIHIRLRHSTVLGILSPVFKRKGSKNEAKYYRGITVLPVIGKCLEFLLRNRIREIVDELQNRLQRGFTPKVAPLYCALILYECTISLILLRNRNYKHLPITGSTVIPL
jgi:hypothetical protein